MTSDAPTVRWSPELLAGLDWKRFAEIVRAVASHAGFELSGTQISQDGAAEFIMTSGQSRTFVRLAPWNQWMATLECIESFMAKVAPMPVTAGIYVAPHGATSSARHAAMEQGIQLVDAVTLAARLEELPPEHSQFYYDIGTGGDAVTPTCPVCMGRLSRVQETPQDPVDCRNQPDVSYTTSDLVADSVSARRIEILKDCEVNFLKEVHAYEIIVHGTARGNFVCQGSLLLNSGATLFGTVAARSVLVRPGAELHGETRILQTDPQPLQSPAMNWVWRCHNPKGQFECRFVSFLPH